MKGKISNRIETKNHFLNQGVHFFFCCKVGHFAVKFGPMGGSLVMTLFWSLSLVASR